MNEFKNPPILHWGLVFQSSLRDLRYLAVLDPPINWWAIFSCPDGTKESPDFTLVLSRAEGSWAGNRDRQGDFCWKRPPRRAWGLNQLALDQMLPAANSTRVAILGQNWQT